MLWTALACMQRAMKGEAVVFVVYTGDVGHGKASKEQILAKVKVRMRLFCIGCYRVTTEITS